jgi:hypothetical protein
LELKPLGFQLVILAESGLLSTAAKELSAQLSNFYLIRKPLLGQCCSHKNFKFHFGSTGDDQYCST